MESWKVATAANGIHIHISMNYKTNGDEFKIHDVWVWAKTPNKTDIGLEKFYIHNLRDIV